MQHSDQFVLTCIPYQLDPTSDDEGSISRGSKRVTFPMATLKYIPGLKYTFGPNFISRQSQGEFICLMLHRKEKMKGQEDHHHQYQDTAYSYFELECKEDGTVWISSPPTAASEGDLTSITVCVNGDELSREQRLFFGDLVTVDCRTDDVEEQVIRTSSCRFLFEKFVVDVSSRSDGRREVQLPAFETEGETEGEGGVLYNPLVLEKVLAFLPSPAIQGFRTLSHLWNEECLKALWNRVELTIFDEWDTRDFPALTAISDVVHSNFLNPWNFRSWRILLPEEEDEEEDEDDPLFPRWPVDTRDRKVLDDLSWLFLQGSHHRHVKSLQISGAVRPGPKLALFETILEGLGPSLTKLNLWMTFPPQEDGEEWHLPLIKRMVGSLPLLQSLELVNSMDDDDTGTCCFPSYWYPKLFFQEIGILQKEEGILHCLADISISIAGDLLLDALSTLRPGSLRKLVVNQMRSTGIVWEATTCELHPYSVLQAQAGSLEEVSLAFDLLDEDYDLRIHFPVRMGKLKSLSLFFDLTWAPELEFTPAFRFGISQVHANFPAIEKLTIWPMDSIPNPNPNWRGPKDWVLVRTTTQGTWKTFLPILRAFMDILPRDPDSGNIFPVPSVRCVDVPFLLGGKYHRILDHLEVIFPNACFPPELAAARQGPVCD